MTTFRLLFPHPDDLEYLVLVKVLEARARDDVLVVLLCEEETGVFESFTVEGVCKLEDVAYVVNADKLSKDLLALLLD